MVVVVVAVAVAVVAVVGCFFCFVYVCVSCFSIPVLRLVCCCRRCCCNCRRRFLMFGVCLCYFLWFVQWFFHCGTRIEENPEEADFFFVPIYAACVMTKEKKQADESRF